MITPRSTRLVRTRDVEGFRCALISLITAGPPFSGRDRLVIVPTRAAAALLTASLEHESLPTAHAVLHPEFITPGELPARIAERAVPDLGQPRPEAREILMGVAARRAMDAGHHPPFVLRPGLLAEMLRFHDALDSNRRDVPAFERLALGHLEPGAEHDRGAERLVRQTRFLVAAFTIFEQLVVDHHLLDDGALRALSLTTPAREPWRHAIVTVGDVSRDRHGLCAADWDLLARVPGLQQLDVVVTDRLLAGAWHEHVHQLLPGLVETTFESSPRSMPALRVPSRSDDGTPLVAHHFVWTRRDREDEVAGFARWVREIRRQDSSVPLDRMALVVQQPHSYFHLGREVLRSANVPCQVIATQPLAGEPYAAALDSIFSAVTTNLSRAAVVALLRSPHLQWSTAVGAMSPASISAADALLSERGYLGGLEALERIARSSARAASGRVELARPALEAMIHAGRELGVLAGEVPAADHIQALLSILDAHDAAIGGDEPTIARQRRARHAIKGVLTVLRDEFRELDPQPVGIDSVIAIIRRWIESNALSLQLGEGVYLVDAESAKFGDFDCVQLAGLVDSEWPERPSRNIFYGTAVLRDLGWAKASEQIDRARAAFVDLLHLAARVVTVSTFSLEDDAIVSPSPFIDELRQLAPNAIPASEDGARIFESEILGLSPVVVDGLGAHARAAALSRLARLPGADRRFHGSTNPPGVRSHSLSALERYQDCPFRYFAADVLGLAEIPEDEPFLSPRARGRFIHEVFERFFLAWDAQGTRTITVEAMEAARAMFRQVATPLLATLNESDATLEAARLFGSAVAPGLVDVVLGLEACRPDRVEGRWLESRFEGDFSLGNPAGPHVALRGVADRVDLLDGHRLRVIDYKTGRAPSVDRALQVPVYALCAQEQLALRDEGAWTVAEASYIAFTGKPPVVEIIAPGDDAAPVLTSARERLLATVAGIAAGAFPPQPHDKILCRTCAYPSVCRKDHPDAHA